MKKVLVLSLVLVLALSGMAFAGEVGHTLPNGTTGTTVKLDSAAVGAVKDEAVMTKLTAEGVKTIVGPKAAAAGDADLIADVKTIYEGMVDSELEEGTPTQLVTYLELPRLEVVDTDPITGTDAGPIAIAVEASKIPSQFNEYTELIMLRTDGGFNSYAWGNNWDVLNGDGEAITDSIPTSGTCYLVITSVPYEVQFKGSTDIMPMLAVTGNKPSSGGGGCNAGLPMLAGLAALAGFFFLKRK